MAALVSALNASKELGRLRSALRHAPRMKKMLPSGLRTMGLMMGMTCVRVGLVGEVVVVCLAELDLLDPTTPILEGLFKVGVGVRACDLPFVIRLAESDHSPLLRVGSDVNAVSEDGGDYPDVDVFAH